MRNLKGGKAGAVRSVRRFAYVGLLSVTGCAGGSHGCSSVEPISSFPAEQTIKDGIQVRVSAGGLAKVGNVLASAIPTEGCIPPQDLLDVGGLKVGICDHNDCANGKQGCPIYLYTASANRPALGSLGPPFPPVSANQDDGKDKLTLTSTSATNISLQTNFDYLLPAHVLLSGISTGDCYLYGYSGHLGSNADVPATLTANLVLGTDPKTDELTVAVQNVQVTNPALTTSGCGALPNLSTFLGTFTSGVTNFLTSFVQTAVGPALKTTIGNVIPSPAGIKGLIDLSALKPYSPPDPTRLELLTVVGGYANTIANGLNLGVLSGLNSDKNPVTRDGSAGSEPASCVADLPIPDLTQPPFSIPRVGNSASEEDRKHQIAPLPLLQGAPDIDTDIAMGVSRSLLRLAGAHAVNSGALCLALGGTNLPSLTTGALSVLLDGTGTVFDDVHAPLIATLKPTKWVDIDLGKGTAADPLVHVSIPALNIDVGVGSPPTHVFSAVTDLTGLFDLGTAPSSPTLPGIEPLVKSITTANTKITDVATKALTTDKAQLTRVIAALGPTVGNVLAGRFGGPTALPSLPTLPLDGIKLSEVDNDAERFLVAAGNGLKAQSGAALDTTAKLLKTSVPDEASLKKLFDETPPANALVPAVSLQLGPSGAEFSYRVDGSAWHAWDASGTLVISDPAFLLQGHHSIDIKARTPGQWQTEDPTPANVDALIDSVPPLLKPAVDVAKQVINFNGLDFVSPTKALTYAVDATGTATKFVGTASVAVKDALAITGNAAKNLIVQAKDEAQNISTTKIDLHTILTATVDGSIVLTTDSGAGGKSGTAGTSSSAGGKSGGSAGTAGSQSGGGNASGSGGENGETADGSAEPVGEKGSSGCDCKIASGPRHDASRLTGYAALLLLAAGSLRRRANRRES
ncbi:MAG TPA: hypothetical protein VH062_08410 [Polyangiaceae bacterium]|jgi:hypothetical protein|nr:hypothetical protein [Polyangiaceae bacterium]